MTRFLLRAIVPKMRRLRDQRGFTLPEILVAASILVIGFMGVQSLGVGIVKGNLMSDRMTSAATLAQDKLERYRQLGYSGATPIGTTIEDYNTIAGYPFFKRETSIEANVPSTGMKKVTVTVYWGELDSRWLTLTNYIAE